MAETVSDILGKGFKYEQREKIERIQEIITGTIGAFVGGANWGPINLPTLVLRNFENNFGIPLTKADAADFSGLAATYMLDYAPFCWYTRVADGSESQARKNIFKAAIAPTIEGTKMLSGSSFVVRAIDDTYELDLIQNNKLSFNVWTPTSGIGDGVDPDVIDISLSATAGCADVKSAAAQNALFPITAKSTPTHMSTWNFVAGDIISFMVDGISYRYTVKSEFAVGQRNANTPDFLNLVLPDTTDPMTGYVDVAIPAYFTGTFALPDTPAVKSTFSGPITMYGTPATSGYQTISNTGTVGSGSFVSGDASGLGALTYDLNVQIDAAVSPTNISVVIAGTETWAQVATKITAGLTGATCAINAGKIRITSATTGGISRVLITEGTSAGLLAAINALGGAGDYTPVVDSGVIGVAYIVGATETVALEAVTAGAAGDNIVITGDSTNTITQLINTWNGAHPSNTVTLITGTGSWIPFTGRAAQLDNGADAITHTSTSITITADTHGTVGNGNALTGNGSDDIADLILAWNAVSPGHDGNHITLKSGLGTQVLKTGTTITLGGGLAAGVGTWDEYVPAADVDTYVDRFIYALKEYVIAPTLYATGDCASLGAARTKAGFIVSASGDSPDSVKIHSVKAGSTSSIKIFTIPKVFTATEAAPITSLGTNTDISVIVAALNDAFENELGAGVVEVMIDPQNYNIQFVTYDAGSAYALQVLYTDFSGHPSDPNKHSFYSLLGLTGTASDDATAIVSGSDAVSDAGTLLAKYTGSDGNTIVLDKAKTQDGYTLTIFFRGYTIATFFNYSYTVSASNFIGTLIAQHAQAAEIVSLEVATGTTELPAFVYGEMTLSGGTSGVSAISETRYNAGLDEYKNVDLYNVDIVCVSGHTSQTVQDKVEEVCDYRQDCFGVIDPPESVAGTVEIGANIYSMIDWHNGVGGYGRTEKLNSKYVATYFPWLSIEDGSDAQESTWYAPSVRVMGAIACNDKLAGHKFAAPAGNNRTPLTGVFHLAQYLREDDKNRLYADEIGNSINPIVYTTTRGFFIDGQKNTDRNFMAISRLNVLRTSLYIKKRMYEIAPNYFWSPLTKTTQDSMAAELKTICVYLSSSAVSAIKDDYTIVCDATLNTNLVEAQRGLIAYIEWTPVRSIEKIKVISVIRDLTVSVSFA